MDFQEAHRLYEAEILRLAKTQPVLGMDPEDVVSEMLMCLWKATQTWAPGKGSFGTWWWSIWLNRRSDINAAFHAAKRPLSYPTSHRPGLLDRQVMQRRDPDVPTGSSARDGLIWRLIASGEPVSEILRLTETSRRGYYSLMKRWRTEEVRDDLRD